MVIRSYTEMMQERLPGGDRLQRNVREVLKAADRAAGLTGQLLAFSRKQILSLVVLDLNTVVADTVKMLKRLIGEDIELRVSPAESLWVVEADPDQIVQVLLNLSVNARDAMPQGGTLTIATRNVTVTEGDGTFGLRHRNWNSKDIQEHIFEPFFTTKGIGKGTGLGLSTVYGIVEQRGGYTWVDSEPEQGACFTIYLPKGRAPISLDGSAEAEQSQRGTETLLVAEDEDALRGAICEFLRGLGYAVLAAGSGQQALAVAKGYNGHLDLLLTDVVMPKMSGRELSQSLTALDPELKTIFMSGYTDDAAVRHGVREAGVVFLQKPFSLSALARKVCDVIGPAKT
jgi:CheY-like chemotaxis protein